LDERIEIRRKEMNKKALQEFMTTGWLHPKFRTFKKKCRIRRFGGLNKPFDLEEGGNIVEAIEEDFPNAK
jgi:hypothetical protein